MRFVLDAPVQPGRSASFDAPTDAVPLAQALFGIDGVTQVQVTEETIVVTRAPGHDWQALKAPIAAAIRTVLDSTDEPLGAVELPPNAEADAKLLAAVKDVLDTKANPSIASHGGHISAEGVQNGIVQLRMSGGCQGCAASAVTLRQGVETMLRSALPAIREIVDVTDHASGKTPFYSDRPGQSPVFARPVPAASIAWEEGELRIDPDYLAPRLGLTPEELQAGLGRGEIVIETGPGAVPNGTQVSVRSAGRAWAADIAPDGTAREIPPPRSTSRAKKAPPLSDRVRAFLEDLPAEELPITYGALARGLGLFAIGAIRRVTHALETTMHEDFEAGRPFIAARVVSRSRGSLPGKGFFDLAHSLGRGPVAHESDAAFHGRELTQSLAGNERISAAASG
jgi:Fe-S cluster biogenesis protein NfuA